VVRAKGKGQGACVIAQRREDVASLWRRPTRLVASHCVRGW
jgi:hypothetical protein